MLQLDYKLTAGVSLLLQLTIHTPHSLNRCLPETLTQMDKQISPWTLSLRRGASGPEAEMPNFLMAFAEGLGRNVIHTSGLYSEPLPVCSFGIFCTLLFTCMQKLRTASTSPVRTTLILLAHVDAGHEQRSSSSQPASRLWHTSRFTRSQEVPFASRIAVR